LISSLCLAKFNSDSVACLFGRMKIYKEHKHKAIVRNQNHL
jgi:hypothetical protein